MLLCQRHEIYEGHLHQLGNFSQSLQDLGGGAERADILFESAPEVELGDSVVLEPLVGLAAGKVRIGVSVLQVDGTVCS